MFIETEFLWLLRELEIVGSTMEMWRRLVGILKCLSQDRDSLLHYFSNARLLSSLGSSFSPPEHFPPALGRGVDWPAVIFVVT